jgi:hypothetical protein
MVTEIDALTRALIVLSVAGIMGFITPLSLMTATGDLHLWSKVRSELSWLSGALKPFYAGRHRRFTNPYSADDSMGLVVT